MSKRELLWHIYRMLWDNMRVLPPQVHLFLVAIPQTLEVTHDELMKKLPLEATSRRKENE